MNVVKDLFGSKKFVTALLAVVTAVLVRLGIPEVTIGELTAVISPMLAYIGAQGFADRGKSAAIVTKEPS